MQKEVCTSSVLVCTSDLNWILFKDSLYNDFFFFRGKNGKNSQFSPFGFPSLPKDWQRPGLGLQSGCNCAWDTPLSDDNRFYLQQLRYTHVSVFALGSMLS